MSRLPGTPLRGLSIGPDQVRALATALTRLHHAIPAADPLEPAAWHPAAAVAHVRALAAARPDLGGSPGARRAFALGTAWLSDPSLDRLPINPFLPVLGMADGNLDLAPAEAARVHAFRRLLALGWLLMLGPDGPATRRNPPGTLDRQAERVLALLDS
ncbi:hypothetical protein [Nonomuraea jabiensis]|uniref:hypothetical protein n=1 Tax=Nonomuraea jabiensis TaxID=882448 RepID=UPI003D745FB3